MERVHAQKIIRLADLHNYVGLRRTQVQQLIKEGRFPRPVQLSARRIGWLESEVAAWQATRIAARDRGDDRDHGGDR